MNYYANNIFRPDFLSRECLQGTECLEHTIGIPLSILDIQKGKTFYGNFCKCGAKTKVLNYFSWTPINTPKPNFHCPEFFQPIQLVRNVENILNGF